MRASFVFISAADYLISNRYTYYGVLINVVSLSADHLHYNIIYVSTINV